MSDTTEHAAEPAPEATSSQTMASIEAAATKVPTLGEVAAPHPTIAAIDAVFTEHLNSLPVACEAQMRPLIEAARTALKARLGAV